MNCFDCDVLYGIVGHLTAISD